MKNRISPDTRSKVKNLKRGRWPKSAESLSSYHGMNSHKYLQAKHITLLSVCGRVRSLFKRSKVL